MTIFLNGESLQVNEGVSLYGILETAGYHTQKGVAVGVNNQVVSKGSWTQTILNENDKILIISATKGG